MPDGFVWRPIRRHFGIRAFGVNAYTAKEAGGQIVEEHSESSLGHEEIYLVLRGRARFTVDGSDHELGPGQLVFLREPSLRRGAVALDGDTVVLALGGKPGEPHVVSAWEAMFAAVPAVEPRRLGRGDRHSPGGSRRAAGASGAAVQPRLRRVARRQAPRRAPPSASARSSSSPNGPRTHAPTPISQRSAPSRAFRPRAGNRRPATGRRRRARAAQAPDRPAAAPRPAPRRSRRRA